MSTESPSTRCPQCGAPHSAMRHVCPSCRHDYRRKLCAYCQRPLPAGVESGAHCRPPARAPDAPTEIVIPQLVPPVAPLTHELPAKTGVPPARRLGWLLAAGTGMIGLGLLLSALAVRAVHFRRAAAAGPTLVLIPVDAELRRSLVALGRRSGDTVQWHDTGVLLSSDGFLLADQAAWPDATTNMVAGVSGPAWDGPLLCVLQDAASGLAVLRMGTQAAGLAPPELSTASGAALTGQVVRFQPDLGDFRAYVLPIAKAGSAVTAAGPDLAGSHPGPLFSDNLRELVAVLHSDGNGASRAVRADQLQELLVRARAVPSRPCGTVVSLPSHRSAKL